MLGRIVGWAGWGKFAVAAAIAVALPALMAMRQINGVLAAMHPPRTASYDVASLSDRSPERVEAALTTWGKEWRRHEAGEPAFRSPWFVVRAYFLLDYVLILAYYVLFVGVLWRLRRKLLPDEPPPAGEPLGWTRLRTITPAALWRRFRAVSWSDVWQAIRTATGGPQPGPQSPAERSARRRARYVRLTTLALCLVPVLALTDLVENSLSLWNARHADTAGLPGSAIDPPDWLWIAWGTSWVKWALALLILVPALVVALEVWRTEEVGRPVARTLHVVRAHILLIVLLAVVLAAPVASEQAADVIRRWPYDWTAALCTGVLMFWFSLALYASARWHVAAAVRHQRSAASATPTDDRRARPPLWAVLAAGAVLTAVGMAAQLIWQAGGGLAIPGVLLVALAVLSATMRGFPTAGPRPEVLGGQTPVLALLAGLPLVLLGLAVIGASIDEIVYAEHNRFLWVILAGLALEALGCALYAVARTRPEPAATAAVRDTQQPGRILAASAVGAAVALGAIWIDPFGLPYRVGLLGVLGLLLVCLALLVHGAIWVSHRVKPLEAFRVVRLQKTPVVTLVIVWALVAGSLADPAYENARVVQDAPAARAWTLQETWERWKSTQPPATGGATPVLLVAASGGGIRAGYWADIALRCVLEGQRPRLPDDDRGGSDPCAAPAGYADTAPARLFVASGISGGSVGLATYAAHVLDGEAGTADWPSTHWAPDSGAAAFSWLVFADLPSTLLLRRGGSDRAQILEQSWERTWKTEGLQHGLRSSWSRRSAELPVPLLLLNGTRVQDGCRFQTSALAAAIPSRADATTFPAEPPTARDCRSVAGFEIGTPGYLDPAQRAAGALATTQDSSDFLCDGDDVRLSTAGLLSARFPVISDSGRLHRDGPCPGAPGAVGIDANVVDGGYFDTSAASPIAELMPALERIVAAEPRTPGSCYVPVLLQLDNSYAGGGVPSSSRPWETVVPLLALGSARDAREHNARQTAALAFSTDRAFGSAQPGGVERYAHIYPRAHPGSTAPLGWTLSRATMEDLGNELVRRENEAAIRTVQRWLTPGALTCPAE